MCFIDYAKSFDCTDHNKLWKILKEMGIPEYLHWFLRNLCAGQEATARPGHGTMDWFKWGNKFIKAVYYHPTYLTYMQSTSWEMPGWMKQESGLLGEISTTWYADDTTLRAESEEELKSLLMRVKKESEKADLKLSIQNTKIMASGPITSWQRDGEKVETVAYFIFLGSKITVDRDCSCEIKRHLLLGRKAVTNLGNIFKKQRHYFANKRPSSQSYGFSSSHVWMWELDYKESWAP